MMSALVPALLVFAAVTFGVVSLALLTEGIRTLKRKRDLEKRLESAISQLQEQTLRERDLIDQAQVRVQNAQELIARMPFLTGISTLLAQSGLSWTPGTFVLLTGGFALAGVVLFLVVGLPLPGAVMFALLFGSGPWLYARFRRKRILKRFESQLPEAIDYLSRAVRAGHPLSAGIQMVGDELADPLGGEFRRIFDQQRFGVPFEEALLGICDRVELVDVRIFATSVIVQREVGGASFGEVLDNMAETIRTRFAIRREIRVYTAQGKLSGMIAGSMPIAVGFGIYLQDPAYTSMLWKHPIGRFMAITAAVLQIVGFLWIRKIVDVEI
jgi:tight adherence protein B